MQQFIKWARGSACKENFTVGPRHDPYSRDVVTIVIDGLKYQVVSCGLAGDYLRLPGGDEVHLVEVHFNKEETLRNMQNYEAEVIRHTGFDSMFWMHKLWYKLDRARYRRDPEAYTQQMRLEEAYDRAYGGCV